MAYLTLAEFRLRTIAPTVDVDAVEADITGYTAGRITAHSARLDSRLRKRYVVPFTPVPEIIKEWLTKLVTLDVYLRRGVDPQDPTLALVKADKELADAEIKEAADSKDGLFDLPVLDIADTSAVTKGGPLGYSETSPYVWTDTQARDGSTEDENSGR